MQGMELDSEGCRMVNDKDAVVRPYAFQSKAVSSNKALWPKSVPWGPFFRSKVTIVISSKTWER